MSNAVDEKSNLRILLVDDNSSIHDDFKKVLLPTQRLDHAEIDAFEAELFGQKEKPKKNIENFEIDSAYQGQEALKMVAEALKAKRPYAMAFVDVRMPPGWDGIQTIEEIWKVDSDLQVVICTAYSDYSWDDTVTRLGNSDRLLILKKPFDNIEVIQLAHALTTKWNLAQKAKKLMEDLKRESRFIQMIQMITLAVNEAETVEDAYQAVLDITCLCIGWPVGHVWLVSKEGEPKLLSSPIWQVPNPETYAPLKEATQKMQVGLRQGFLGEVLAGGNPAWVMTISENTACPRAESLKKLGLCSCFAVPVIMEGQLIAVIEFFSNAPKEYDLYLMDVMSNVADQLSKAIHRKLLIEEKLNQFK